MKRETEAVLLRIFVGEHDRYQRRPLYAFIADWLRRNHFSGVTVVRAIAGFGNQSIMHKADILDLSSDLPIIIEVVDEIDKIEMLKRTIDEEDWITSGLITEETVKIIRYGR